MARQAAADGPAGRRCRRRDAAGRGRVADHRRRVARARPCTGHAEGRGAARHRGEIARALATAHRPLRHHPHHVAAAGGTAPACAEPRIGGGRRDRRPALHRHRRADPAAAVPPPGRDAVGVGDLRRLRRIRAGARRSALPDVRFGHRRAHPRPDAGGEGGGPGEGRCHGPGTGRGRGVRGDRAPACAVPPRACFVACDGAARRGQPGIAADRHLRQLAVPVGRFGRRPRPPRRADVGAHLRRGWRVQGIGDDRGAAERAGGALAGLAAGACQRVRARRVRRLSGWGARRRPSMC